MPHVPDAVRAVQRDLKSIFGDRLQSIIVHGLHAAEARGPHSQAPPAPADADHAWAQTLAIVDNISAKDLTACAERVASWHRTGAATPLMLTAEEFKRSLHIFPLEFGAILADHVVVSGKNPFDGVNVDAASLRSACEVQARSHLLHLREGYVETAGNADALAVLIVRSAPALSALLHSIARLQGVSTHDHGTVGRHTERLLDIPGGTVTEVVKLAGITEISSEEAVRLFPGYLGAVERLVGYVAGWKA